MAFELYKSMCSGYMFQLPWGSAMPCYINRSFPAGSSLGENVMFVMSELQPDNPMYLFIHLVKGDENIPGYEGEAQKLYYGSFTRHKRPGVNVGLLLSDMLIAVNYICSLVDQCPDLSSTAISRYLDEEGVTLQEWREAWLAWADLMKDICAATGIATDEEAIAYLADRMPGVQVSSDEEEPEQLSEEPAQPLQELCSTDAGEEPEQAGSWEPDEQVSANGLMAQANGQEAGSPHPVLCTGSFRFTKYIGLPESILCQTVDALQPACAAAAEGCNVEISAVSTRNGYVEVEITSKSLTGNSADTLMQMYKTQKLCKLVDDLFDALVQLGTALERIQLC